MMVGRASVVYVTEQFVSRGKLSHAEAACSLVTSERKGLSQWRQRMMPPVALFTSLCSDSEDEDEDEDSGSEETSWMGKALFFFSLPPLSLL